jgi:hypothetical protein
MKQYYLYPLLLCLTLLSACTSGNKDTRFPSPEVSANGKYSDENLVLKSILVLPTEQTLTANEFNTAEIANLEKGAQTLTSTIGSYFINNPSITLLNQTQMDVYLGSFIGQQLKEARYIGMQAGADAVLISQIYRYRELDGKEYGANEPASVGFDYQLIHLESGVTLCKGTFEETQQTLMSNLLTFGKASKRKFKFVKAARLLEEGIEEKFGQCSHLSQ